MYSSKNETYCQGIISCLYDINNKLPINYFLIKTRNERDAFRNQIKYLKKDDTVIFDRGYYSFDIIEKLELIGVNYIFRLKSNKKEVQYMLNNNIIDYKFINKNINNRIVNYRVNDSEEDYFLITNLTSTIDNPILKSKYKINNKTGIKIFSKNIIYLFIYNKITNKCFEKINRILSIIVMNNE